MKNNFFFLLLITTCLNVCAQSDVATAKWMHVIVDGNNTEWGSLNFYDDQTQLNFGLANDSNNIYFCFAATNEPVQMKLMRAGMKLTLSTKGKIKHEASILFPLPQTKQPLHIDSAAGNKSNYERPVFNKETFRQNYIAHNTTMQVNGFTTVNGEVPIRDSDVQLAVNWDSASNLIYEIAIAKKEFFGTGYTAQEAAQNITLSVEVNALPHFASGNERSSNGYQGNMHGSGMHGESMHGSGRYGEEEKNPMGNTTSTSLNTKTSFKQRFVLNNGSN